TLTDTLPVEVNFAGGLGASSGVVNESNNLITWSGAVNSGKAVTIHFEVTVSAQIFTTTSVINQTQIADGRGNLLLRQAKTIINGFGIYLPLVKVGH
ncbi:MAG: hypothetical protein KAS38_12050, partial [Anaerolineales bacterium]|nr:hypothetical protein [Anaerolineales bacterium]